MEPWYKVTTPRKEVREGRSFSPDEFAIALEQVVAGTAPEDYKDPAKFFSRTCFTRALREHTGTARSPRFQATKAMPQTWIGPGSIPPIPGESPGQRAGAGAEGHGKRPRPRSLKSQTGRLAPKRTPRASMITAAGWRGPRLDKKQPL